ncbi:hypothetical protein [Yaniella flava]|uniref:hypothetical protein n=1 Tax=Yaniella flava TaxID=287930 RepID=UPI0031D10022
MLFAIGAVNLDGPVEQGLVICLKAVAVAVVAHAVWGMAKVLTPDLRRFLIGIAAVALVLLLLGNLGQLIAIGFGVIAGIVWCCKLMGAQAAPLKVAISKRVGVMRAGLFAALLIGLPVLTVVIENPWVSLTDAIYRAGALVFDGGHVASPILQAEPAVLEWSAKISSLRGTGPHTRYPGHWNVCQ